MSDYSKAKISLTLFTKPLEEKPSDKYPDASGYFEITLADLEDFYQLAKAIEPTLNYKNEPAVALKMATWNKISKAGKPYQSCSVEPKAAAKFMTIDPADTTPGGRATFDDDEVI